MDVFQAIQAQMQGMAASDEPPLADVDVSHMAFHPAGTEAPLLRDISFHVPAKKLGLIYGRSGAGKTTLLQLIAGLTAPTSGSICINETAGNGMKSTVSSPTDRLSRTGLVFQFPERHFLASTLQQELAFAWPTDMASLQLLSSRAAVVLPALGLAHIPLETQLRQLSDGYKRRCALAVALVRRPSVLLLDEPLAGLDWRSRADIASVLGKLKEECTVIVVSHDLREIAPLVDVAWQMQPNGTLSAERDIRLLDNAVL
ncbi:g6580 [Coccomyxa viridis]|uniref:G6580 protein n=1 Tax=Coccomyxa viridis TaxID=1274662 RepID=A0ABP1FY73_9CHLO